MNRSDLIARMTERLGGDRTAAAAAVTGVLEEIEAGVARGERVTLSGFGSFDRRERAARTARNPRTGAPVRVEASVVPVFRAATGFKSVVRHPDGAAGRPEPVSGTGDGQEGPGSRPRVVASTSAGGSKKAEKKKKEKKRGVEQVAGADSKAAKKAAKKARKATSKAGKKTA